MSLNFGVFFSIFMLALFTIGFYKAIYFPPAGRIFPLIIAGSGLVLTIFQIVIDLKNQLKTGENFKQNRQDYVDIAPDSDIPIELVRKRGLRFLGWIVGLYLGIYVFGFKIAVPVFFVSFLRIEGKASWFIILLLTTISIYAIFFHFENLLGVFWPRPLIVDWIKLPSIIY